MHRSTPHNKDQGKQQTKTKNAKKQSDRRKQTGPRIVNLLNPYEKVEQVFYFPAPTQNLTNSLIKSKKNKI